LALTPGTRLGPYEIVALLGPGGMGEVYRARDTRLDRTVAVKVLSAALAADPQFKERFDREARAISQLTHPNICTLYDVGEQDRTAFLVMELLDGGTLADRLTKGALPLDQALTIAIDDADDAGEPDRAGHHSRHVSVHGARAARMPRRRRADGHLRVRRARLRDAHGQKAFEGKSQASLIGAIMHASPPPIAASQPLAPASLDHVVRRCLAKDPDERWQSASDVMRELKWIAESASGADAASASVAAPRVSRRWTGLAGVAVLGVLLVGAMIPVALYFRRAAPDRGLTRLELSTPPTADPVSMALSPDGRQIAFVAAGDGGPRLWVRQFGSGDREVAAG
jgi:serine/threonine protein kinase